MGDALKPVAIGLLEVVAGTGPRVSKDLREYHDRFAEITDELDRFATVDISPQQRDITAIFRVLREGVNAPDVMREIVDQLERLGGLDAISGRGPIFAQTLIPNLEAGIQAYRDFFAPGGEYDDLVGQGRQADATTRAGEERDAILEDLGGVNLLLQSLGRESINIDLHWTALAEKAGEVRTSASALTERGEEIRASWIETLRLLGLSVEDATTLADIWFRSAQVQANIGKRFEENQRAANIEVTGNVYGLNQAYIAAGLITGEFNQWGTVELPEAARWVRQIKQDGIEAVFAIGTGIESLGAVAAGADAAGRAASSAADDIARVRDAQRQQFAGIDREVARYRELERIGTATYDNISAAARRGAFETRAAFEDQRDALAEQQDRELAAIRSDLRIGREEREFAEFALRQRFAAERRDLDRAERAAERFAARAGFDRDDRQRALRQYVGGRLSGLGAVRREAGFDYAEQIARLQAGAGAGAGGAAPPAGPTPLEQALSANTAAVNANTRAQQQGTRITALAARPAGVYSAPLTGNVQLDVSEFDAVVQSFGTSVAAFGNIVPSSTSAPVAVPASIVNNQIARAEFESIVLGSGWALTFTGPVTVQPNEQGIPRPGDPDPNFSPSSVRPTIAEERDEGGTLSIAELLGRGVR